MKKKIKGQRWEKLNKTNKQNQTKEINKTQTKDIWRHFKNVLKTKWFQKIGENI